MAYPYWAGEHWSLLKPNQFALLQTLKKYFTLNGISDPKRRKNHCFHELQLKFIYWNTGYIDVIDENLYISKSAGKYVHHWFMFIGSFFFNTQSVFFFIIKSVSVMKNPGRGITLFDGLFLNQFRKYKFEILKQIGCQF